MVARTATVAFQGIEVLPIDVQVQVSSGLPSFTIVGLPDKAVAESRERIRAAFHAIGVSLPSQRVTVNLAPADIQKEGSHYDLPIALGLLSAIGALSQDDIGRYCVLGELGLDGSLTSVAGVLPAALEALNQGKGLICPSQTGGEAVWAGEGLEVLAPSSLLGLLNHFKGSQVLSRPQARLAEVAETKMDLKDVKGQETARRALEIAAAGEHNLMMVGPPGIGKSMLASRLPTILPPLEPQEALEVSMIHSIAGILEEGRLICTRPYRDPHHSASLPSMVGGGVKARPGEVSLAHRGVLFMDEIPEFARATLEALRQPLETGRVMVSRANAHITYPAQVQLVAAMNPCRCGYLSDAERACSRAPKCAIDYQTRLSGPFLDRMDIFVEVENVSPVELRHLEGGESSEQVRDRVMAARSFQKDRLRSLGVRDAELPATNARLEGDLLRKILSPTSSAQDLLDKAVEKFKFSARQYNRLLKVARTIADLEASPEIGAAHMGEALMYRKSN
jgi:magnesium chelatase family protein